MSETSGYQFTSQDHAECRHLALEMLVWKTPATPVERLALLYVLHMTAPGGAVPGDAVARVTLRELADLCGMVDLLTASRAVSALEARGILKTHRLGRLVGEPGELWLSVDADGLHRVGQP
jgi:hypothetical protein